MATRTIALSLLALTLGACALEPMDPAEDPIDEQSSTLTGSTSLQGTQDSVPVVPQVGQPGTVGGADPTTAAPNDSLRTDDPPNKPQPDPWAPTPVVDPYQGNVSANTSANTSSK